MIATDSHKQGMTPFFSEEHFHKLATIMRVKQAHKGDFLFREGDDADHLYWIKEGRVRITKLSETGKSLVLYLYQSGDLFGQLDPFQHSTQSFSAEVTEEAVIGIMQKRDLEQLLSQQGDLAVQFIKWMGLLHRMTETKFRDLLMYGKAGCALLFANPVGQFVWRSAGR